MFSRFCRLSARIPHTVPVKTTFLHPFRCNSRSFSSPVEVVQTFEPKVQLDEAGNPVPPKGPRFVPNVGFVDEEGNRYGVAPEDENITLSNSTGPEQAPLSSDMWTLFPKQHDATLIWLPGLGETYDTAKHLFEMMQTQGIRFVVPNPPKNVVTALGDRVERAWFDVMTESYDINMEEDLEGLQQSSALLRELIDEEALLLGSRFTPEGTSLDDMLKIGARRVFVGGFAQGGALALYTTVRYPNRLAGIISFSGYFPFANETLQAAEQAQKSTPSTDVITSPEGDEEEKISTPPAVNLKCPVLAIHGRLDPTIPLNFATETYKIAQSPPMNMRIQMRSVYEMKHFMADHECFGMHEWIMTFVRKFPKWKVFREHF